MVKLRNRSMRRAECVEGISQRYVQCACGNSWPRSSSEHRGGGLNHMSIFDLAVF